MRRSLIALATGFALLAAACGGGGDTTEGVASLSETDQAPSSTVTSTTIDPEEALMAFTACMREQGIELEDPTVDAEGNLQLPRPPTDLTPREREEAREAFQECADLLEGVALGLLGVTETELEDALVRYAACMREQGYDLPDPDFSQGLARPGGIFGRDIDPNDPAFQAADAVCRDVFTEAGIDLPFPRSGR